MDLLRTAMVDIAMRIATCHALKSAPVRGERATRCSRRVRLRRELKRGTVAYLDVLCRARLVRVDDDLLARCRVAAEQQMPLALAHRRSLQRMRDRQSGVPAGLLCAANVAPPWLVHTAGTLAKLFSEAVEAIDPRPVDGIRATGAPTLVEVLYGVVPQVLPLWLSFTLYRFESDVRSAAVVGMVGAGGIGVVLHEVIRGFQYAQTAAVLVILVVTVTLIDLLSAWLRNRYI